MIDAASLTMILQRNYGVIQRQINGLTHEQSLIQAFSRQLSQLGAGTSGDEQGTHSDDD